MAEIGEKVILKSGGPDMIITYVIMGSNTRDKAAMMKGFKKGDVICEWQQEQKNGKMKGVRQTFSAAMLKYPDGTAVAEASDDDDDDDDDDW